MFAGMTSEDARPVLRGKRFYLRPPLASDWRMWAEVRAESREFLEKWEPTWPADALSRLGFRRRIRLYQRDARADQAYAFFVFSGGDDQLVGGITYSNIRRGVTQSASAGYWVGRRFARQGVMSAAICLTLDWAFGEMGLHRVEAACLPENIPSADLLLKCGFTEEGYARRYLRINGRWQDHRLFAILETDPRPSFE